MIKLGPNCGSLEKIMSLMKEMKKKRRSRRRRRRNVI
jgi:hypothetical protein